MVCHLQTELSRRVRSDGGARRYEGGGAVAIGLHEKSHRHIQRNYIHQRRAFRVPTLAGRALYRLQIIGAAGFCERFGLLLLLDTLRYCGKVSVFYNQCYCPMGGSL